MSSKWPKWAQTSKPKSAEKNVNKLKRALFSSNFNHIQLRHDICYSFVTVCRRPGYASDREYCEIFKNIYFEEHLGTPASITNVFRGYKNWTLSWNIFNDSWKVILHDKNSHCRKRKSACLCKWSLGACLRDTQKQSPGGVL